MTLEELTTPFERRRVIEYGADGHKVVRHWHEVQNVIGTLHKGRTFKDEFGQLECGLFIFFPGVKDGLSVEKIRNPDHRTVEQMNESIGRSHYDSAYHMVCGLDERIKKNQFIGNAQIEFVRQFDPAAADRFARHRSDFYARQEEKERQERLARQAAEDAEKARQQAELAALKALYLGWADQMTPLRFGKADATMGALCRADGKVMTRREFVISCVKDGWEPRKDEGVTTWYGSKWESKETKPRTVHKLVKDNLCYVVSKTEYDFAAYLAEHREVLA